MAKVHGQHPLVRKRANEFARKQRHNEKIKEHLLRRRIKKALREQHLAELNDYREGLVKRLGQLERWADEERELGRPMRAEELAGLAGLLKKKLKNIDEWARQAKENPE